MATPAKVIDDALSLPREQRAELATTLLRSLDDDEDEDPRMVEAAWAREIERRVTDRDAGRTGSVPFDSAMAAISAQLAAERDPENR